MNVRTVDYLSQTAEADFVASLKETGFAVLRNHPLNWKTIEDVYAEWGKFFNSDNKEAYLFDKSTQEGYYPPHVSETAKGVSSKDIKEFYHVRFPNGTFPGTTYEITQQYFNAAMLLGRELLGWLDADLEREKVPTPFDEPLIDTISTPHTLLRVLHYPAIDGSIPEGAVRAAAHEDINWITLLPAATAPGLQVRDMTGAWHDVACDAGSLIVNIGDMLQEATSGRYRSTTHRVINPPNSEQNVARMSLPLFIHPKPDIMLSNRHTADSYLQERLRELGHIKAEKTGSG